MHCCEKNDADILSDLEHGRIPDEVLANKCCWSRISQVRGRTFKRDANAPSWDEDGEIWRDLCRRRGRKVFARGKPRNP